MRLSITPQEFIDKWRSHNLSDEDFLKRLLALNLSKAGA